MTKRKVLSNLRPEQEARIPEFSQKWRSTELSTQSINRPKATEIIKNAYKISGYEEPEIMFYSNPLQAIQAGSSTDDFRNHLGRKIRFRERILNHLTNLIEQQLTRDLFIRLRNQTSCALVPYDIKKLNSQPSYFPATVLFHLETQLFDDLADLEPGLEYNDIKYFTSCLSRPAEWASLACMFDYCFSVLDLSYDSSKWQILQQLICETGFLFLHKRVCIACERPSALFFDENNQLPAEGQLALKFVDGYSIYANLR